MNIPKGATIAVADGEKLNLYRNDGDEAAPSLSALADAVIFEGKQGLWLAVTRAVRPTRSDSQQDEDSFAAGTAQAMLQQARAGR